MEKVKNKRCALLFLFLTVVFLLPGRSAGAAATDDIQKEIQYITTDKTEKRVEQLPKTLQQEGRTYTRDSILFRVVAETPVTEEAVVSLQKKSGLLNDKEEYVPEAQIRKGGVKYELVQTIKKKKTRKKGYSFTVSGSSWYESRADAERAPAGKRIKTKDPKTGKTVTVLCKKTGGVKRTADIWKNTYIDVVFIAYDASHFIWNGIVLEKNTKTPLKGYYRELVESVGGSEKNYKVKSVSWKGKSYKNKNGVLCRRARALVRKRTPQYRVRYTGKKKVKKKTGIVNTSTYAGIEKINTGTVNYKISATTTYHAEKSKMAAVIAGAALGILFLAAMISGILLLFSKRKQKEKKHRKEG